MIIPLLSSYKLIGTIPSVDLGTTRPIVNRTKRMYFLFAYQIDIGVKESQGGISRIKKKTGTTGLNWSG